MLPLFRRAFERASERPHARTRQVPLVLAMPSVAPESLLDRPQQPRTIEDRDTARDNPAQRARNALDAEGKRIPVVAGEELVHTISGERDCDVLSGERTDQQVGSSEGLANGSPPTNGRVGASSSRPASLTPRSM